MAASACDVICTTSFSESENANKKEVLVLLRVKCYHLHYNVTDFGFIIAAYVLSMAPIV